jgi:predicted small secreted protein
MWKRLLTILFAFGFTAALAACGDTWEGAKEDTSENLHSAGDAVD